MRRAFTTPCRNAEKGHPNILFWNVRCQGLNNFLMRLSFCVNTGRLRFRQNSRCNGVRCIQGWEPKKHGSGGVQLRHGAMCSEGGQHANLVVGPPTATRDTGYMRKHPSTSFRTSLDNRRNRQTRPGCATTDDFVSCGGPQDGPLASAISLN
jgi:hypothetical protein